MKFQKLLYFLQNVGRDPSSLMQEDYLTGLKNRRFLLHYLKYALDWDNISDHPVSLLLVDIDYFKRINEQYGSGVGDQVLVHVAGMLKQISGKNGIPVLNAGDEFMVIMPNMKKQSALVSGFGTGNARCRKSLFFIRRRHPDSDYLKYRGRHRAG